jgi:hypothetical protein
VTDRYKKKTKIAVFILSIWVLLCFGANKSILGIIYWDGPYYGRVINAETNEPIADAAVAGIWEFEHIYFFISTIMSFANATETITDAEGRFVLPRVWAFTPWFLTRRLEMRELLVFKSGYDTHPPVMFYSWTVEEEKKNGITRQDYLNKYWVKCNPHEECLVRINKASTLKELKKIAGVPVDVPPREISRIKNTVGLINQELIKFDFDKWEIQ